MQVFVIINFIQHLQSTMFSRNDSISLQGATSRSVVLRKNIRVSSSKLPSDFFNTGCSGRYDDRKQSMRKQSTKESSRHIFTPSFEIQEPLSPIKSFLTQRKIGTATINVNKEDDLIHEVIRSARNLRGVLRQKSLEIGKKSKYQDQLKLNLPKIKNPKLVPLYL